MNAAWTLLGSACFKPEPNFCSIYKNIITFVRSDCLSRQSAGGCARCLAHGVCKCIWSSKCRWSCIWSSLADVVWKCIWSRDGVLIKRWCLEVILIKRWCSDQEMVFGSAFDQEMVFWSRNGVGSAFDQKMVFESAFDQEMVFWSRDGVWKCIWLRDGVLIKIWCLEVLLIKSWQPMYCQL